MKFLSILFPNQLFSVRTVTATIVGQWWQHWWRRWSCSGATNRVAVALPTTTGCGNDGCYSFNNADSDYSGWEEGGTDGCYSLAALIVIIVVVTIAMVATMTMAWSRHQRDGCGGGYCGDNNNRKWQWRWRDDNSGDTNGDEVGGGMAVATMLVVGL